MRQRTVILVILIAVVSVFVVFLVNQPLNPSSQTGYWILNVSTLYSGAGKVQPNGTVYVPMNQTGLNVTATPSGWNGFMDWKFDGSKVNSTSSTIFVPRQQKGTNHTLEAEFIMGTPPIYQIVTGNMTINANSFKAYNFTVPSGAGSISDTFSCNGTIRVYVMDSENFANWQNKQIALSYYDSGQVTNGKIDNLALPSSGTYFLVYYNNNDTTAKTVTSYASFFYIPP